MNIACPDVLTNELLPGASGVDVEITDGKGVKIFRTALTPNAFGVAAFELDLASELNYGTWKIAAESGSAASSTDVRVEKYVLPRFDVEVIMADNYFLVDEVIAGTVNAHYFFGKPVDGTVEILAGEGGPWESAMPAWEKFLTVEEMWDVILFLYDHTGQRPRELEGHGE